MKKIVHLFHDLMNLYGEYANTLALVRALSERGEEAVISRQSVGDKYELSDADFIYIGSGTERSQKAALAELLTIKDELSAAPERGTVILATGNSFEMFGEKITDKNGKEFAGLGMFGFTVTESDKRTVEDSEFEFQGEKIIGFVNKASEINGIENTFFTVKSGAGNNPGQNVAEGIIEGNFYGTHLIGPLLIRNKFMAEYFAELLMKS